MRTLYSIGIIFVFAPWILSIFYIDEKLKNGSKRTITTSIVCLIIAFLVWLFIVLGWKNQAVEAANLSGFSKGYDVGHKDGYNEAQLEDESYYLDRVLPEYYNEGYDDALAGKERKSY